MNTEIISFEEILPIWKNFLWPIRSSAIEPVSCIQLFGEKDYSILNAIPTFFAVRISGKIVGVNSGFKTSPTLFRSRGIFVFPEYRKLGISTLLFDAVCNQAKLEGCSTVWSMPRLSAVGAYHRFGFKTVSNIENRYNEQNEDHEYVTYGLTK